MSGPREPGTSLLERKPGSQAKLALVPLLVVTDSLIAGKKSQFGLASRKWRVAGRIQRYLENQGLAVLQGPRGAGRGAEAGPLAAHPHAASVCAPTQFCALQAPFLCPELTVHTQYPATLTPHALRPTQSMPAQAQRSRERGSKVDSGVSLCLASMSPFSGSSTLILLQGPTLHPTSVSVRPVDPTPTRTLETAIRSRSGQSEPCRPPRKGV